VNREEPKNPAGATHIIPIQVCGLNPCRGTDCYYLAYGLTQPPIQWVPRDIFPDNQAASV
jgi:hypothetical protein